MAIWGGGLVTPSASTAVVFGVGRQSRIALLFSVCQVFSSGVSDSPMKYHLYFQCIRQFLQFSALILNTKITEGARQQCCLLVV